ncbi:MAG: S8 family serine peptidase [Firmicutes bacterium]|nr:S8 family serine peptidase [Bacillota bacterium]
MNSNRRMTISCKGWLIPVLVFAFALALAVALGMGTSDVAASTADPAGEAADPGAEVQQAQSLDEFIDRTAPDLAEGMDDPDAYALKRVLVDVPLDDLCGAESAVEYNGQTVLTFASEEDTKAGFAKLREDLGEEHVLLDEVMLLDDDSQSQPEDDPAITAPEGLAEDPAEESPPRFHGWGTEYMGLSYQLARYEAGAADEPEPDGESGLTDEPEVDPSAGDDPVTVAVLDSGICREHEIFDGVTISDSSRNFVAGEDQKVDPADISDDFKTDGHGTGVCGIIAESLPPNRTELMVLKIADSAGRTTAIQLQQALSYALEHGAEVINLSMSGGYSNPARTAMAEEVLKEAAARGVIVCGSSGNNRENMDRAGLYQFPAESPYVVCVGAIDNTGRMYRDENYGSRMDFTAPGAKVRVASAAGQSEYHDGNGTSFACPYIAACAAYLKLDRRDHSLCSARILMQNLAAAFQGKERPVHSITLGYGTPAFAEDTALGPVKTGEAPRLQLPQQTYTYNGRVRRPVPAVTFGGLALSAFDIRYLTDGKNIGTHRVRVTVRGCFVDPPQAEASYKIVPGKVRIKKVKTRRTGRKSGRARITWTKGQTYYQIQLSRKASFSAKKTWTTKKRSKLVKGLKRGKTYYVRVRTMKKAGGGKYWSAWSKTRKIKIK